MRGSFLGMLALLSAAIWPASAAGADVVYVMRHLEKGDGLDPPLSSIGSANARAVAGLLASRGITAVFATPTRRAIQTAEPLASKLGIPVTRYDPGNADALVQAVTAAPGDALIVGHSNTVGDIVSRLGGRPAPLLTEQDYGTIYVVARDSGRVSEISIPAASDIAGPERGR